MCHFSARWFSIPPYLKGGKNENCPYVSTIYLTHPSCFLIFYIAVFTHTLTMNEVFSSQNVLSHNYLIQSMRLNFLQLLLSLLTTEICQYLILKIRISCVIISLMCSLEKSKTKIGIIINCLPCNIKVYFLWLAFIYLINNLISYYLYLKRIIFSHITLMIPQDKKTNF